MGTAVSSFVGMRLQNMRCRRGMTKKTLADLSGIDSRYITKFEVGKGLPTDVQLTALADALDADPGYFSLEWEGGVDENGLFFRAPSRMLARNRYAAIAMAQQGVELYDWMEHKYQLPVSYVPDYTEYTPSNDHKAELAADLLRRQWGLGVAPIPNMVTLMESKGIAVLSTPNDPGRDLEFDAFSFKSERRSFVFLNTAKTGERARFDAAHELGHLVLGHDSIPDQKKGDVSKRLEADANQFASAFLMPRESLLSHFRRNPSLTEIKELKKYWRVSALALCHRLHQIGMLTDWLYHSAMVSLSKEGYRTGEPDSDLDVERSKIFNLVVQDLRQHGEVHDLLDTLHQKINDLSGMTFGSFWSVHEHGAVASSVGNTHPLTPAAASERAKNLGLRVINGAGRC